MDKVGIEPIQTMIKTPRKISGTIMTWLSIYFMKCNSIRPGSGSGLNKAIFEVNSCRFQAETN